MKKGQIYSSMLNGDWLKGAVPNPPHEMVLTIAGGRDHTYEDDKKAWIIRWQEPNVPEFGVNLTNWDAIEQITGQTDSDHWTGHKVAVYWDPGVRYGTKITGGVRVRAPQSGSRSSGSQSAPAQQSNQFGDAWASKFLELAGSNGLELADVEHVLEQAGYPANIVKSRMATWPRDWKDAVKAACERADVPVCENPGMTEDDIPF